MRRLFICLITSGLLATSAQAQSLCEGWGTLDFAKAATAEIVTDCLEQGASLTETFGEEEWTVFHQLVVDAADLGAITAMIDAGADLNVKDGQNATPFLRAVWASRETDVLALLVDAGAQTQEPYENAFSPLHMAAKSRQADTVAFLLDLGVDPNPEYDGMTPLAHTVTWTRRDPHTASERGYEELKESIHRTFFSLIAAGADPTFVPGDGVTLFQRATDHVQNPDIVRFLLENGGDVNMPDDRGHTPLHEVASGSQDIDLIRDLIAGGGDVNAKTDDGRRPIDLALSRSRWQEVLPDLLAVGMTLGDNTADRFSTLRYAMCDPEKMEMLVGLGADPVASGPNGETLLHHVPRCYGQKNAIFDQLIAAGVPHDSPDNDGNTALMSAVDRNIYDDNARDILGAFAAAGSNPHRANNAGLTPWGVALRTSKSMSEAMVEAFAIDLDATDAQGKTMLHMLIEETEEGVFSTEVRDFLGLGANPNTPDAAGTTPLHMALGKTKHYTVYRLVSYLLENGADPSVADAAGRLPLHIWLGDNAPEHEQTTIPQIVVTTGAPGGEIDTQIQDALDEFNSQAVAQYDPQAALNLYLAITEALIPDQTAINMLDQNGHSPIFLAASRGRDKEVLALLIAQGANPQLQDPTGLTPLAVAIRNGHDQVAEHLLRVYGANPNIADNDGQTPLHHLALRGNDLNQYILRLLFERDADFNVRNNAGQMPLDIALDRVTDPVKRARFEELDRASLWFWQRWFR